MGHLLDSNRVARKTKSPGALLRTVGNPRERAAIKKLRDQITGRKALLNQWWVWVIVLGGLLILFFVTAVAMGSVVNALGQLGCCGVVLVPIVALVGGLSGSGARQSSLWRAMLWHGRCAACGQSLQWCEPDAEGVVSCADCGSGWAMDRLRWGACPGCGYRLGGLPSDSMGQVCCPECGGKWRLPDHVGEIQQG